MLTSRKITKTFRRKSYGFLSNENCGSIQRKIPNGFGFDRILPSRCRFIIFDQSLSVLSNYADADRSTFGLGFPVESVKCLQNEIVNFTDFYV